jgi:hypothetical protein
MHVELDRFRPRPHPFRAFFLRHRIPQIVVANYVGCSQSTISQLLRGYRPMPPEVEDRLLMLVNSVQAEQ